jgi:hypothetical protein
MDKQRKGSQLQGRALLALSLRADTYNPETHTVRSVISSDKPVPMWWGDNEILIPEGMTIRGNASSVPLLDNHRREENEDVIGRVTGIAVQGNTVVADLMFDSAERAVAIEGQVSRGILTDVSIGYTVQEFTYAKTGESYQYNGRSYEGPAYIATKWELSEVSIVPIGADVNATLRALNSQNPIPTTEVKNVETNTPEVTPQPANVAEIEKRATAKAIAYAREMQEIGKRAKLSETEIAEAIDNGTTIEAFAKRALAVLSEANKPAPVPAGDAPVKVEFTRQNADGIKAAFVDGMISRTFPSYAKQLTGERAERAAKAPNSLHNFLRQFHAENGDTASATLGGLQLVQSFMNKRAANHTTSLLADVVLDAQNKFLNEGFRLNPGVWPQITFQRNVTDLKTVNNISISNGGPLRRKNQNGEYEQAIITDGRETYNAAPYGSIYSVTLEALINDDMSVFSRMPLLLADSANQTLDLLVLSFIHGTGQTMADAAALFTTGRGNYTPATGTAMSVASLQVGINALATQKDANGNVLNRRAEILLCSSAKEATAMQLIGSDVDPASNGSAMNPYRNRVLVVTSAHLSAGFTFEGTPYAGEPNAWYLLSNTTIAPALELAAVNGQFAPQISQETDFGTDGLNVKATLLVGGRAIDPKAIYKNVGA